MSVIIVGIGEQDTMGLSLALSLSRESARPQSPYTTKHQPDLSQEDDFAFLRALSDEVKTAVIDLDLPSLRLIFSDVATPRGNFQRER